MSLLKDLVYCDEGFERLYLVGKNRLARYDDLEYDQIASSGCNAHFDSSPECCRGCVIPCIYNAGSYVFALW